MAKTPGSNAGRAKGKKTQLTSSHKEQWGGSKIDTPGVHGSGFGFSAQETKWRNDNRAAGARAGGSAGVGPSGAKRGRPPGVKNGQGRGKK